MSMPLPLFTSADEQRVDALMQDWFGNRSTDTFVHAGNEDRSDWQEGLCGGYSSYLIGKKSSLDVLKTAYRLCRNRLCVLLPGKTIGLSFRGKDSYTNGKNIVISTEVVDEKKLSPTEKLDVLLGLTTHEAAHILHTNFSPAFVRDKFQKTVLNILEDERIEYLMGEEFPGYTVFLEGLKAYYFDFKHKHKRFTTDAEVAFDCFFRLVRFPRYVDRDAVAVHAAILEQIKACITPYPLSFVDAYHASVAIADLFEAYFGKMNSDEPESIKKLSAAIADAYRDLEVTSRGNKDSVMESKTLEDDMADELIREEASFDPETSTYFIKALDGQSRYEQVRKSISGDARSLANVLLVENTTRSFSLHGLRHGKLDESKLVDAMLGRDQVYIQNGTQTQPTINVVLLIDESGSMGGDKIENAQRVSILFNEAFKYIPKATLMIYGFTSDFSGEGTNTLTIYREPGLNRPYALGQMEAKASNRDGVCIRAVVNRLKKRPGKTLLFIISDGMPSGSRYYGEPAIRDTRAAVEEATKKGFVPIQIGIEVDENSQALMFDDFVNYESSKQMVEAIRKLLRTKIKRVLT